MRWVAFLIVAATGVSECGSSTNRGSQCTQVMRAVCPRLVECMLVPADQNELCVQSGVNSCCAGNCGAGVVSTQQEIDRCVADLEAASCDVLNVTAGGTLPETCQGVVHAELTEARSSLSSPMVSPATGDATAPARAGRLISE